MGQNQNLNLNLKILDLDHEKGENLPLDKTTKMKKLSLKLPAQAGCAKRPSFTTTSTRKVARRRFQEVMSPKMMTSIQKLKASKRNRTKNSTLKVGVKVKEKVQVEI